MYKCLKESLKPHLPDELIREVLKYVLRGPNDYVPWVPYFYSEDVKGYINVTKTKVINRCMMCFQDITRLNYNLCISKCDRRVCDDCLYNKLYEFHYKCDHCMLLATLEYTFSDVSRLKLVKNFKGY